MKEIVKALGELDKAAEERYEEREQKGMRMFMEVEEMRRKVYAEEAEKHRQAERLHEERMHYMFLSFLQQNLSARGRQGVDFPAGPPYDMQPSYGPPFSTSQPIFPIPRSPEESPYSMAPFPFDEQSTPRST